MTVPLGVLWLGHYTVLANTYRIRSKSEQPQMPAPQEVSIVEASLQTTPIQRCWLVGLFILPSRLRRSVRATRGCGILQKRIFTEGTEVKEGRLRCSKSGALLG